MAGGRGVGESRFGQSDRCGKSANSEERRGFGRYDQRVVQKGKSKSEAGREQLRLVSGQRLAKRLQVGETRSPRNLRIERPHTGGKGWCPDPVHHKYIARKWTKNLQNTHLEYSKDIQNFPSQFN